ncbi:unnamed protein product [Chondrus crispus]|uniref:Uncharacterized protein n=1 Tax=Chondrus crispus TaxID=2769 RepID=R7QSX3_CHOCR|nr:unnamed protein product [Chondrus crispus]CDF40833.1 unnamed protein product [Chondrus crispus]|eukprot:XP_005711127.1 unnamed protein product [Chondrus crispus]
MAAVVEPVVGCPHFHQHPKPKHPRPHGKRQGHPRPGSCFRRPHVLGHPEQQRVSIRPSRNSKGHHRLTHGPHVLVVSAVAEPTQRRHPSLFQSPPRPYPDSHQCWSTFGPRPIAWGARLSPRWYYYCRSRQAAVPRPHRADGTRTRPTICSATTWRKLLTSMNKRNPHDIFSTTILYLSSGLYIEVAHPPACRHSLYYLPTYLPC